MDPMTNFVERAAALDPKDRALFVELLRTGRQLSTRTLHDLALEFKTGAGTISRWEHGHAAPPPVARAAIIGRLKVLVSRIAAAAAATAPAPAAATAAPRAVESPRTRRRSGEMPIQVVETHK